MSLWHVDLSLLIHIAILGLRLGLPLEILCQCRVWVPHHVWCLLHVRLEATKVLPLPGLHLVHVLLVLGHVGAGHAAAFTAGGLQTGTGVGRNIVVDWGVGLSQWDGLSHGVVSVPV